MIYRLIVLLLFVCCLVNHPVKACTLKVLLKIKMIDTLLLNSHLAINAGTSNNITPTPAASKMPITASRNVLNRRKIYHTKSRREKIEVVAEKVRKIQVKVDKIEARIREIELQDQ